MWDPDCDITQGINAYKSCPLCIKFSRDNRRYLEMDKVSLSLGPYHATE